MNASIQILTIDDVYAVLKAMHYVHPLPHNRLFQFLTDNGLLSEDMPSGLQEHLVATWMSGLIITHYNKLRAYHLLPRVDPSLTKQELIDHVSQDYISGSERYELQQWSCLFVYCVCPNTPLTKAEHATVACVSHRQLRRYRHRGIHQLWVKLCGS